MHLERGSMEHGAHIKRKRMFFLFVTVVHQVAGKTTKHGGEASVKCEQRAESENESERPTKGEIQQLGRSYLKRNAAYAAATDHGVNLSLVPSLYLPQLPYVVDVRNVRPWTCGDGETEPGF